MVEHKNRYCSHAHILLLRVCFAVTFIKSRTRSHSSITHFLDPIKSCCLAVYHNLRLLTPFSFSSTPKIALLYYIPNAS